MSERKAKVSIGLFGQKLGFNKENVAPQRKLLMMLMGQAAVFQPDTEAATIIDKVKEELTKLDGSGNVRDRIKAANDNADDIKGLIDTLRDRKKEEEKQAKANKPSKGQLKVAKKLQDELEKLLNAKLKAITPELGKVKLESDHSPTALNALGETIRRDIRARDPNEEDREEDIRSDIATLEERVTKANKAHSAGQDYLTGEAADGVKRAEVLLKQFDKQVGGTYEGPLVRTMEVLRSNMTAQPLDPALIKLLLAQVEEARQASKKDKGFVTSSHTETVEKKNAGTMQERLDSMLESIKDAIDFLRRSDAPGYPTIEKSLSELRIGASKPIGNGDITKATLEMRGKVSTLVSEVEKQQREVGKTIAEEGKLTQQALVKAKQAYTVQFGVHGETEAAAADWKSIEALMGSAEEIVPATGALPRGITIKDLKLAKSLAEKAVLALEDLKTNTAKLLTFDEDAKALKKALEERTFFQKLKGNARGLLETYNPEKLSELSDELKSLLKELPTTPSKDSMATFTTLKAGAEKAVADLTPIANYLEGTATPLYNTMKSIRLGWVMAPVGEEGATRGPKAFDAALDQIEVEIGRKPPVLSMLQAVVKAAQAEVDKVEKMKPGDLTAIVGQEELEQQKLDQENKKQRSAELKRLAKLEDKYSITEDAVNAVKGDRNALGAAKRLIDVIKKEIDANAFKGLAARRKDLDARLELLLKNPRGEANRRRSELPGVLEEVIGATGLAATELRKASDEIGRNDPGTDEDMASAQQTAVALFKAYIELIEDEVDGIRDAAKPLVAQKSHSEDERRKSREEALRILRSYRNRLRAQPMTRELLASPFQDAKGAVGPVFRCLDKLEYTLTTAV